MTVIRTDPTQPPLEVPAPAAPIFGRDAGIPEGHRHYDCPVEQLARYPYPCKAQDLWPDDAVYHCTTHGCWWHVDPATGLSSAPGRPQPRKTRKKETR